MIALLSVQRNCLLLLLLWRLLGLSLLPESFSAVLFFFLSVAAGMTARTSALAPDARQAYVCYGHRLTSPAQLQHTRSRGTACSLMMALPVLKLGTAKHGMLESFCLQEPLRLTFWGHLPLAAA